MERDLNEMSDEEMLTYCRNADQETVRTCVSILAQRYKSSLLNYIYRMVGDRDIAEDLLQETFVRIYRKSREYRQIARFSTWLFKIATNLSLNEIRNRRHRPGLTLDLPVERSSNQREPRYPHACWKTGSSATSWRKYSASFLSPIVW